MPVSARRSVVLPWSMWPAVPTTTLAAGRRAQPRRPRARDRRLAAPRRAPRRPPARPSAGRGATTPSSIRPTTAGVAGPQPREQPVRRRPGERHGPRRQRLARQRAAADRGLGPRRRGAPGHRGAAIARRPAPPSSRTGAAICRQTGISRDGDARPGTAPSVAATAARITLSGRIARASGSRRSFATRSARPTTNPACGPPTSLSPLNVTRSAPAARRSAGIGSWASPNAAVSSSAPEPRSSTTIAPCACAASRELARVGRLREPVLAEVRRVDAQDEPRPAVGEHLLEVGDPRPVRRAHLDQPRAGPPDDLRDPDAAADLDQLAAATRRRRRRPARPTASASAAALLVTTSASSAPVSATRCSSALAIPAAAAARLAVELEEQRPRGGVGRAAIAASRPRRPPEVRVDDHAGRVETRVGPDAGLECREPRDARRRPAPRATARRRRRRPGPAARAPRRPRRARR